MGKVNNCTVCTICRIVAGELPSAPVLEGPEVVAFMDMRQPQPGHVLVVPRTHYARLAELPAALACAMTEAALRLTAAIYRTLAPAGVNLTLADGRAAGQEIMHVHLHVRPRAPEDGILTVRPCAPSGQPELATLATRIRTALAE
ncbi:MAG: HIT domain-containing protein [Spirochaetaceae bacterium]|nr:HIT domain-containing protein [Spirochaetaceae bacterium]